MSIAKEEARFVSLASTASELFALDGDGNVWRYVPAEKGKHYAFWTKLTGHRSDPAEQRTQRST